VPDTQGKEKVVLGILFLKFNIFKLFSSLNIISFSPSLLKSNNEVPIFPEFSSIGIIQSSLSLFVLFHDRTLISFIDVKMILFLLSLFNIPILRHPKILNEGHSIEAIIS
jgi:hypothetical protein